MQTWLAMLPAIATVLAVSVAMLVLEIRQGAPTVKKTVRGVDTVGKHR